MPRKKRPLNRGGGILRDASLVVIASEDKFAVENYFRRFRTTKVQFEVLPTLDGNSAPEAVLERLDEFRRTVATEEHDQFWICIDLDSWADEGHIQNLVKVLQLCRQKGYNIAINNPCIELWFLLHFADFATPAGAGRVRCHHVIAQLEVASGKKYYKDKCHRIQISVQQVLIALERAIVLDGGVDDIPQSPSARIYRIVEMLKQRDSIDLR
jgi:hypothetical protein